MNPRENLIRNLAESLIYLYGIVPADAPDAPADLQGLEGGSVSLLRLGTVAAISSRVPGDLYADEELESRILDLQWVGARGMAHERVLDWYAERGPVIPLSLLSLHEDENRATARVRSGEDEYAAVLERLRGRTEWGIKLWRREEVARQRIDELSESLRGLSREIEEAPPGKRFLLERRRDAMRTDEVRSLSKKLAHEVYSALGKRSVRRQLLQLPSVSGGERTLLLHSAYLVQNDQFELFRDEVTRLAAALGEAGIEIEFTGPWPPYHFSAPDDD